MAAGAKEPTPLPTRPERSEGEIIGRRLTVRLGGRDKGVPVLPIGPMQEWKAALAERASELARAFGAGDDIRDWAAVKDVALSLGPTLLELLIAYDREAALGGREWLEANATEEEVYEAFKVVAQHAFPFVRDILRSGSLTDLLLDQAARVSSTNSPSANGESDPTKSTSS